MIKILKWGEGVGFRASKSPYTVCDLIEKKQCSRASKPDNSGGCDTEYLKVCHVKGDETCMDG